MVASVSTSRLKNKCLNVLEFKQDSFEIVYLKGEDIDRVSLLVRAMSYDKDFGGGVHVFRASGGGFVDWVRSIECLLLAHFRFQVFACRVTDDEVQQLIQNFSSRYSYFPVIFPQLMALSAVGNETLRLPHVAFSDISEDSCRHLMALFFDAVAFLCPICVMYDSCLEFSSQKQFDFLVKLMSQSRSSMLMIQDKSLGEGYSYSILELDETCFSADFFQLESSFLRGTHSFDYLLCQAYLGQGDHDFLTFFQETSADCFEGFSKEVLGNGLSSYSLYKLRYMVNFLSADLWLSIGEMLFFGDVFRSFSLDEQAFLVSYGFVQCHEKRFYVQVTILDELLEHFDLEGQNEVNEELTLWFLRNQYPCDRINVFLMQCIYALRKDCLKDNLDRVMALNVHNAYFSFLYDKKICSSLAHKWVGLLDLFPENKRINEHVFFLLLNIKMLSMLFAKRLILKQGNADALTINYRIMIETLLQKKQYSRCLTYCKAIFKKEKVFTKKVQPLFLSELVFSFLFSLFWNVASEKSIRTRDGFFVFLVMLVSKNIFLFFKILCLATFESKLAVDKIRGELQGRLVSMDTTLDQLISVIYIGRMYPYFQDLSDVEKLLHDSFYNRHIHNVFVRNIYFSNYICIRILIGTNIPKMKQIVAAQEELLTFGGSFFSECASAIVGSLDMCMKHDYECGLKFEVADGVGKYEMGAFYIVELLHMLIHGNFQAILELRDSLDLLFKRSYQNFFYYVYRFCVVLAGVQVGNKAVVDTYMPSIVFFKDANMSGFLPKYYIVLGRQSFMENRYYEALAYLDQAEELVSSRHHVDYALVCEYKADVFGALSVGDAQYRYGYQALCVWESLGYTSKCFLLHQTFNFSSFVYEGEQFYMVQNRWYHTFSSQFSKEFNSRVLDQNFWDTILLDAYSILGFELMHLYLVQNKEFVMKSSVEKGIPSLDFSDENTLWKPNVLLESVSNRQVFNYNVLRYDFEIDKFSHFISSDVRSIVAVPVFSSFEYNVVLFAQSKDDCFVPEDKITYLKSMLMFYLSFIENHELFRQNTALISNLESKVNEQVTQIQHETTAKHQAQILAQNASNERAYSALTRGIAHEVRNPLAMILSGVELMQDCSEDKAKLDDYADAIKQAIMRLKQVTSTMMRYGSSDGSARVDVDVNALLQQAVILSELECRRHNILMKTEFSNIPPMVLDANAMSQVFMNVILNAIESIGDDGEIILKTACDQREGEPACLQICVQDSGPGISEDAMFTMFDPFYTSKQGNTGLGMPMMLKTVDAHDGKISVCSTPEERVTRVEIELPLQQVRA